MGKTTVRSVLASLIWRPDRDMRLVSVHYVHRGAPGDMAIVFGKDIVSLSSMFMHIIRDGEEVQVPFHRVRRVVYDGKTMLERKTGKASGGL